MKNDLGLTTHSLKKLVILAYSSAFLASCGGADILPSAEKTMRNINERTYNSAKPVNNGF